MVYFTDGTTDEVYVTDNVSMQRQSATQYLLTVTPTAAGWNYGRITDPVGGTGQLVSVVRQSDGCEINLRNFWQTDRTLIDGTEWLYEDNIHFVDNMTLGTESYLLTFTLKPELVLEVASITDVSSDGNIQNAPLKTVTVTFNKPIDADTFTADDITLNCQGSRVNEEITITQVSNMQFTLDLSKATTTDGYYVLTIQTAGITDATGFIGEKGKSVSWIQNLPTFVRETLIMPSVQPCYLLSGQRINRPVRRGVYIRNGRKVIVR